MDWLIADAPLGLAWLGLVALFAGAAELGYALRRRMVRQGRSADDDAHVGYVISAALGLLALLLGFTFSVALSRYEARRDLVVAEANAIGSVLLLAELAPAADRARLTLLLDDYGRTRLAFADPDADPARLATLAAETERLQAAVWAATGRIGDGSLQPLVWRALLDAVGGAIDRAEERDAAFDEHVPARVIVMLLVYATVTAGMLGFALGGSVSRHRGVAVALFGLLAIAIVLILDLDRPRSGSIVVSQRPIEQVAARASRAVAALPSPGPTAPARDAP